MRIVILCPDGEHYVGAQENGLLYAQPTSARCWEKFQLEELSDGRFALKTIECHPLPNQYVRAEAGGGGNLIADRTQPDEHEKFTLESLPEGRLAIRTVNDLYWRADQSGGGALDCGATVPDAWEAFTIQLV
ncbi:fascin domain-containing protein [Roseimaritima ulvae]|uniref:Ricin B lectin domain-containing protein n=1 Tax=Roseimaritima ulvae TaxID=980254 RepID=A0A5B9R8N7_9BACT|nr:hypothetical protein [Roseimaritima ulvae]QEG43211.1 hypothetical protein UC8_52570 [Roseimaritima ulvae]